MTMKCIYAIPRETVAAVRNLCSEYSDALASYSDSVVAKSDELREVVENSGGPVLELDNDDWAVAQESVSFSGAGNLIALLGEIFWAADDAKSLATALKTGTEPASQSVAHWLLTQVSRGRSFVLLSR